MDLIWLLAGVIPLGAGAFAAASALPRLARGAPRGLTALVLAWASLTIGVEALGAFGRLDRPALVAWSCVMGLAGLVLMIAHRRSGPTRGAVADAPPSSPLDGAAVAATVLVAWVAFRLGIVSISQPVKVVSDGPIYHLYFAARWWQAGRIEAIASPFGEVGATYFWANGEVWYAWLMTLFGGDRFAKVGQVPFFLASGCGVAALARTLGANASAARIAAAWFLALGPMLIFAFEPNVDAILVAGYVLAALFFVRAFRTEGPIDATSLLVGALAAGLGMGTKPTGIVFFPPVVALAGLGAFLREARAGRSSRGLVLGALVPLLTLAMMGYWPIRNALWTGNPLYPLHVEVGGRVVLAGWFGPEAMQQSHFYIPRGNWRALGDILTSVVDGRLALAWVAAALGAWAIGRRRPGSAGPDLADRSGDRWVVLLAIVGLLDLAAYWLVIPYRTQQRFCLPGFALLAIPLARLLDRSTWLRWAAAALLALHLLTPEAWPFGPADAAIPWDLSPSIPNARPALLELPTDRNGFAALGQAAIDAPGRLLTRSKGPPQLGAGRRLLATVLLGLGALGAVVFWDRARSGVAQTLRRRAAALALLAPLGVGAAWCVDAFEHRPFPGFADFYFGWDALDHLAGPGGARVAYAGNKIPYYLMGSGLRNRVQYVNVDRHRDWLLHDYHRHAPEVGDPVTWLDPYPVWDRLHPNYDAWLTNLRAERIDFLVVMRTDPSEGRQNYDAEGFPIERIWADRHPADFQPVFGPGVPGTRIRVYEVLPPKILR